MAESLTSRRVVSASRVKVIPNGLSAHDYFPDPILRRQKRQELGINETVFLWLAVGRLEEQKDYPNLLHAFALVVQKFPNAQLRIVGKGTLLNDLQRLADKLNIKTQCQFLGYRQDVPALLNAADGVVLASAWEGLPNAIMEALATGKPVVATKVGGISELIEDEKFGFLIPLITQ